MVAGTVCVMKRAHYSGLWSRKAQGLYRQAIGWLQKQTEEKVRAGAQYSQLSYRGVQLYKYPGRSTVKCNQRRNVTMRCHRIYDDAVTTQAAIEHIYPHRNIYTPFICITTDCHIATYYVKRYYLECLHRHNSEPVCHKPQQCCS